MDFRTLINKLDSFNTEAKKEPERLTFVTALQHVKDITFSPPTKRSSEFSIANNIAFKGQDVNDPKVKLPLVQNALKVSPAMLFGEIAQRIKPTTDAQISLSDLLGNISNKMDPDGSHIGMLTKEEKNFAVEVVKAALRGMSLERDPDQSTYKDSDEPDASEMESTNEDTNKDLLGDLKSGLEDAKAGNSMSDFIADEIGDYIRSGIEDMGEEAWQDSIEGQALAELDPVDTPEEQAKAFQNAINILKGGNESTNDELARMKELAGASIGEAKEDSFDEAGCKAEMKRLDASGCSKNEMLKKVDSKFGCGKEKFEKLYASSCGSH